MAKLVSNETAAKLQELLARQGSRGIGLPNAPRDMSGASSFDYSRWRLDYNTSLSVKVLTGAYLNQGITALASGKTFPIVITGAGNDVDGYAATFEADVDDYYVWLELYHATTDKQLTANVIKIMCSKTLPSEPTRNRDIIKVLGRFSSDPSGNVLPSSITRYWIGDIDNVTPIPDGELSPALTYPIKTLEWRQGNFWEWQIWDADTSWTASTKVPTLPKDANGGGVITWVTSSEITVVTNVRYDTSTHKLQMKTRTITVLNPSAESDWTDITTAGPCP